MATRTSIRPRPVDISRQLNIVRDVAELDNTDDIDTTQNQVPGTAFEQPAPAGPQKKKKEVKEIPVPEVRIVPGYTREYLPVFRIPDTYLRGKGGVGWSREDYCEYDLDNEDEDWLEAFNAGGANRLAEDKFEQMLWRLEVANAEANQRLMSEPGYATDWRMLPAAVAATGNMSRDEALSVLRKYACARDPILHAVYDYWRGKRERLSRPIMRRLQAPTNPSDTNPYNVFRPRERVNRPQTRRRRENTQDCLDKMRQIRESMLKSLELTELLTFREARKRDIHRLDVDMQRYQLARHHHPRHQLEAVEAEAAALLQETQARSRQGESRLRAYLDSASSLGASTTSYDSPLRRALLRKRRRQEMEGCVNGEAIARLPPPPLPADDEMLLLYSPDPKRLFGQAAVAASSSPASPAATANGGGGGRPGLAVPPSGLDLRCVRTRISRCGRVMLTRCDPLTLEPHPPAPPPGAADHGSAGGAASPSASGGGAPPSPPLAARHPLLLSSQVSNLPWAAALDLDLLPEGIADKAALRAQRERRANADRLNAAMLRSTQQALYQQAAGGMVGAASVAGAAAAAATAAAAAPAAAAPSGAPAAPPTAATGSAAAAPAAPAAPASRPPPPPPPTGAVVNQGAPAGVLPHVPQAGAPSGTLPHLPAGGAAAAGQPPPSQTLPVAGQPSTSTAVGAAALGSGPPGTLAPGALQSPQAPGSGGGQARKVPKVAGTPGANPSSAAAAAATPVPTGPAAAGPAATRSPPPAGAPAAAKPTAAAGAAAPGTSSAALPAPIAPPPTTSNALPSQPAAATPVGLPAPPPNPAVASSCAAPVSAVASAGAAPAGLPAQPGAAAAGASTPGAGPAVKKMLPTSKAVAGPSSASQLKRGPGRPPKAAKSTPNGDGAPPSNTTIPMDML